MPEILSLKHQPHAPSNFDIHGIARPALTVKYQDRNYTSIIGPGRVYPIPTTSAARSFDMNKGGVRDAWDDDWERLADVSI